MKPTYSTEQQGFDFGTSNMLEDVCCVFDMPQFPLIEPEDIACKLRCRGGYAMEIYRKCMEIWEHYSNMETVEYLRGLPDHDEMSIPMMAIVLGVPVSEVESDLQDALNNLAYGLEQTVRGTEDAA